MVQYAGSQDGEQIWLGGLSAGLDKPDLIEVRAPKPTLTLLTSNDGVFPLQVCPVAPVFCAVLYVSFVYARCVYHQGGRDAFAESSLVYSAYSAGSNISTSEAVGPHGWITPNNQNMVRLLHTLFLAPDLWS